MSDFPPRAERRLHDELIIWLTTVSPTGRPQASPVWFLWDGKEFLVYSKDGTARTRNIEANPSVSLNLDGDGQGGSIVTIEGTARIDRGAPPPPEVPSYAGKYRAKIDAYGWTLASLAADYPVPIRITHNRVRCW